MSNYSAICKKCNTFIHVEDIDNFPIQCEVCHTDHKIDSIMQDVEELDSYPIDPPYTYISIVKKIDSLHKIYRILEPYLSNDEKNVLLFIRNELISRLSVRLDELKEDPNTFLVSQFKIVVKEFRISLDELLEKKLLFYLKSFFIGYDKIDTLMKDPHIEDISCDGAKVPIYIHHRDYGSLETTVVFDTEDQLSQFVVKLAQKCGKNISVSKPMLDATMPEGSRIQMTLSGEITTRGSTFTIRKFRSDPITPIDLIEYNTISSEMMAYLWLAVEHGSNALVSGGTAS